METIKDAIILMLHSDFALLVASEMANTDFKICSPVKAIGQVNVAFLIRWH